MDQADFLPSADVGDEHPSAYDVAQVRNDLVQHGPRSHALPESVLDTYAGERKPHARALIRLAKLIGFSMTQGGRAGDLLRRAIAPRLHGIPGPRDRLLESETPPLGLSALVEGRGLLRSLNGRLCPNAVLTDDIRYDDVTHGGYVFVTRVSLSPQQCAVLDARGTKVLQVAPGSPLFKWLADGNATAVLVQPDITVQASGREVERLCEAAPKFLVA